MKVTDFDFPLPEALIARQPAIPRDSCRLLVLHKDGAMQHRGFSHLPEYLREGDLLLLNDTKVFPAKLTAKKETGGKIEMLLVRETDSGGWEVLTREKYTGKVRLSDEISGEMLQGKYVIFHSASESNGNFRQDLWTLGSMPLPPYIKRAPDERDKEWYQTVYASREGSIAAPTAGLHFTGKLLSALERRGVLIRSLTLHVGTGTFKPLRVQDPAEHRMDAEYFEIPGDLPETISQVKDSGRRVVAVGTTAARAIEGFFSGSYQEVTGAYSGLPPAAGNAPNALRGWTDVFIYPGYQFRAVDSLVTNFHLPGSTPLMLTSALAGIENLLGAYRCAMRMEYRFFSYGDAMLIP